MNKGSQTNLRSGERSLPCKEAAVAQGGPGQQQLEGHRREAGPTSREECQGKAGWIGRESCLKGWHLGGALKSPEVSTPPQRWGKSLHMCAQGASAEARRFGRHRVFGAITDCLGARVPTVFTTPRGRAYHSFLIMDGEQTSLEWDGQLPRTLPALGGVAEATRGLTGHGGPSSEATAGFYSVI